MWLAKGERGISAIKTGLQGDARMKITISDQVICAWVCVYFSKSRWVRFSFQVFWNTEAKASSRRSANGVYATKDVFAVLPTGCDKFWYLNFSFNLLKSLPITVFLCAISVKPFCYRTSRRTSVAPFLSGLHKKDLFEYSTSVARAFFFTSCTTVKKHPLVYLQEIRKQPIISTQRFKLLRAFPLNSNKFSLPHPYVSKLKLQIQQKLSIDERILVMFSSRRFAPRSSGLSLISLSTSRKT